MKITESPSIEGVGNRRLRFYLTNPSPCPYLEGKKERKVFTNLAVEDSHVLHDALSQSGFRRSQSIAYRPACAQCSACRPTRVLVDEFTPTKRWKRVLNKNQNLERRAFRPTATREQYRLLKAYLQNRHLGGGMAQMSYREYVAMLESSPIPTVVFEYREKDVPDAPLVAVAIADVLRDGLSMVYTGFDPAFRANSIGNYLILDHIEYARELGLKYVFLGYWVHGSEKMNYKADFRPMEVFHKEEWLPIEEVERELGIGRTTE